MAAEHPRILLGDDDDDLREVLGEILISEGYAPVRVASAQGVLDALDRQIFRALIIDAFSSAGRKTLENVAAIVRKAGPTPVGLISGWKVTDAEIAAHGLRFAMLKPFDIPQLVVEVARMLGDPLDPEKSEPARIAQRYFRALDEKDWDALEALCAEDVRFAGPELSRFAAVLEGRTALRRHSGETFRHFSDAKFRDLSFYATPGGIAARYLGTWTKDGASLGQAGTALLQIRGGLIQRIGIEMNQALLDRLAPA